MIIQSTPVQQGFQRQVSAPNLIPNQQQFLQIPSQNILHYPYTQKVNSNHPIIQQAPQQMHIPVNHAFINHNNQPVFRHIPQQNSIQTRTNNFIGNNNIPQQISQTNHGY